MKKVICLLVVTLLLVMLVSCSTDSNSEDFSEDALQLIGETVQVQHNEMRLNMVGVVEAYNDALIKVRETDTGKVYCFPYDKVDCFVVKD